MYSDMYSLKFGVVSFRYCSCSFKVYKLYVRSCISVIKRVIVVGDRGFSICHDGNNPLPDVCSFSTRRDQIFEIEM